MCKAFPAPLLYGAIIDSICVVQQHGGCSRKGACLLYDHDNFRYQLHALPLIAKIAASVMYTIGWFISRRSERFNTVTATVAVVKATDVNDNKLSDDEYNEFKVISAALDAGKETDV